MKLYGTFTQQSTGTSAESDWRKQRDHFAAMLETARLNGHKMSQFERESIRAELDNYSNTQGVKILGAAIEQYHQALDTFRAKEQAVEKERVREIARWDASKLAPEMQVVNMRVSTALQSQHPEQELKQLYAEAQLSGDNYKIRAAADALKQAANQAIGSPNMPAETLLRIDGVARQAAADLKALRTTPEIVKAQEVAKEAFDAAMKTRAELLQTDAIVNMAHTFTNEYGKTEYAHRPTTEATKALSRIQETHDGKIIIKPREQNAEPL
jgi:hypothetical protein